MSGFVVPEFNPQKVGKRIQVFPSIEGGRIDAFDKLVVREREHGRYWIPLSGYLSPAIPIFLKLAIPTGDVIPAAVRLPADRWLECMQRWLSGGEHKRVRKELGEATGFYTWRKRSDAATAMNRCSGHLQLALKCWLVDEHCWLEDWGGN